MQKNFTLFQEASFVPHDEENMRDITSDEVPSDAVIQNILNFSKALRVETSASAGPVEIVLN